MKERLGKYQTAGVDSGVIVPPPLARREQERETDRQTYIRAKRKRGCGKGEKERSRVRGGGGWGNSFDLLDTKDLIKDWKNHRKVCCENNTPLSP